MITTSSLFDKSTPTQPKQLNEHKTYPMPIYQTKQPERDSPGYSPISDEIYSILHGVQNKQNFVYVDGDNNVHKEISDIQPIHKEYFSPPNNRTPELHALVIE
ncbi:hypothetical protein QTN25_009438 [Entamoeba marina]